MGGEGREKEGRPTGYNDSGGEEETDRPPETTREEKGVVVGGVRIVRSTYVS